MIEDRERGLDRTIDALADAADAGAIEGTQSRPIPPFAAVLARAQRIDPSATPRAGIDDDAGVATSSPRPSADALVDQLVAAARDEAELSALEHATPPQRRHPSTPRRTVGLAVAAAIVLLSGGAVTALWSMRGDAIDRAGPRDPGSLAAAAADRDDTGGLATAPQRPEPEPPRRPARRAKTPAADDGALEAAPLETIEGKSAPAPDLDAPLAPGELPEAVDAEPTDERASDAPTPAPQRRARALSQLDRRAAEALASGQLGKADALLARLIRRGGRDRLAEAAFGDRFAIAHRLHSAAEQRKLWRAYLERFPKGRFAQDARAGLCRRSAGDAAACWQRYLDDFPTGAYRAQAERALRSRQTGGSEEEP